MDPPQQLLTMRPPLSLSGVRSQRWSGAADLGASTVVATATENLPSSRAVRMWGDSLERQAQFSRAALGSVR